MNEVQPVHWAQWVQEALRVLLVREDQWVHKGNLANLDPWVFLEYLECLALKVFRDTKVIKETKVPQAPEVQWVHKDLWDPKVSKEIVVMLVQWVLAALVAPEVFLDNLVSRVTKVTLVDLVKMVAQDLKVLRELLECLVNLDVQVHKVLEVLKENVDSQGSQVKVAHAAPWVHKDQWALKASRAIKETVVMMAVLVKVVCEDQLDHRVNLAPQDRGVHKESVVHKVSVEAVAQLVLQVYLALWVLWAHVVLRAQTESELKVTKVTKVSRA